MAGKGKGNMVPSKTTAPKADIVGMPVMKQAKKKGDAFKDGGAVKKKAGGVATKPAAATAATQAATAAPGKKSGGAVKLKDGGVADGGAPMARGDKAARKASGGAVSNRGRSPFSAASTMDPHKNDENGGYY